MTESPTGRGYTQGSNSYRADDIARMEREERRALIDIVNLTADCGTDRLMEIRSRAEEALRAEKPTAVCTCRDSDFGMDVDRCPMHGKGCA